MAKDGGKVSKNAKTQKDAAQSAASKAYVKVIMVGKTGKNGYAFKENIVHKDKVKDFISSN
jgi:hypothetical protein